MPQRTVEELAEPAPVSATPRDDLASASLEGGAVEREAAEPRAHRQPVLVRLPVGGLMRKEQSAAIPTTRPG